MYKKFIGRVVEIDESLFVKVKHFKGKDLKRPQVWVFGMYERPLRESDNRRCLFIPVPKRDAFNLLNIIYKHIEPGSVIISDCWKAYNEISSLDKSFEHLTVNHSLHFVDPDTQAHTNGVESIWNSAKIQFKTMRGVSRKYLNAYLTEFMWRKNTTTARYDATEAIIDAIAQSFPLNNSESLIEKVKKLTVEDKEESETEKYLDVDDIGKQDNFPLPLYLPDDEEEEFISSSQASASKSISDTIEEVLQFSDKNSSSTDTNKTFNFFTRNNIKNNLSENDSRKILEEKVSDFIKSDDLTFQFSNEYSRQERAIIHELAEKFNLKHHSFGESPNRHIIIGKMGSIIGNPTSKKIIQAETEIFTQPIIPNDPKVQEIIDKNLLEIKKTPKKRGRKPKNATNNVQAISNPASNTPPMRVLRSKKLAKE
jgi:transposase-like protein